MIEKAVYDYLKTALSTPVYMEVPEEMPEKFVVLEKTGSGRNDRIDDATFAIQSYAGSLYETALLNDRVKAAMDAMADTEDVSSAKLNTDYNFPDTVRKRNRYQAVYDIRF